MITVLEDLNIRLEKIKYTFGQEKIKEIDRINYQLSKTPEGFFYFQEHPYKCQCDSCLLVGALEAKIAEAMRFPFWEEDKIGKIYPNEFLQFIDSCKVEDNLIQTRFYIENQEYRLLENFWNKKADEYNDILEVNSFSTRHSNKPKNEAYKDYILLPFAKETNGFDNYGYLFFLSKIDSISDGKIYYLDVNWANKIALVANCFNDILVKKSYKITEIFNQTKFINDFLKNHDIDFDNENEYSNWSLEETNTIIESSKLDFSASYFKLIKMDFDYCCTNIYNNINFSFSYENYNAPLKLDSKTTKNKVDKNPFYNKLNNC